MTGKYATGKIHSVCEVGSVADTLKNSVLGKTEKARTLTFSQTLSEAAFESVVLANVAIETAAPWQMAKDDAKRGQLDSLLYTLAESLRIIAILISPVLPKAAHGIFDQLSWKMEPELAGKEERFSLAEADWGRLPDGHMVGKPTPLFPRIEV
jgi:methionyl-tRNA synthetase